MVSISSKVARIEDATTNGVPYSAERRASYAADSFEVVLTKNGAQMAGHTVGGHANKAVTFWREVEAVS